MGRAATAAVLVAAAVFGTSLSPTMLPGQSPTRPGINYDESKVAPYTLPDPLVRSNGAPVRTAEEWRRERRPELLALFEREVYGKVPPAPAGQWFETRSVDSHALNGLATRKEVRVHFERGQAEPYMDVLLYVPNARRAAAPVFLALTYGNHSITTDTAVSVSPHFLRDHPMPDSAHGQVRRGEWADRWPIATPLLGGAHGRAVRAHEWIGERIRADLALVVVDARSGRRLGRSHSGQRRGEERDD